MCMLNESSKLINNLKINLITFNVFFFSFDVKTLFFRTKTLRI